MVMVVKAKRLLELTRKAAPALADAFDQILYTIGGAEESHALDRLYRNLPAVNFSKELLEKFPLQDPAALAVLPVRGVYWSDWGSIHRVMSDLRAMGQLGRYGSIMEDEYLVAS
jgi:hypothetical protein